MAIQLELIPLSTEEKHAAGLLIARLTLDLEAMKADHASEKREMAEDEKALRDRIVRVAKMIQAGRRRGQEADDL